MVTTYDIAKKAGVHQGTVSRVLAGVPHVSPETAKRVLDVCKMLNYVPNELARGLRTRRTFSIAVHIPDVAEGVFADPFVLEFISGVTREAARRHYSIILSYNDPSDSDVDFTKIVKSKRADGVIITSPLSSDPRIEMLKQENIPCALGHYLGTLGKQMVCVDIDNRYSGYLAAKFLFSRGYTHIGLITGPEGHIVGEDFKDGFCQAFIDAGLKVPTQHIKQVLGTFELAKNAAEELLRSPNPPHAIVAFTALTTFGVLQAVTNASSDIKVLGVGTPLMRCQYPNLPYIHSPISELGKQITGALIDLIETGKRPKKLKLLRSYIIDEHGKTFEAKGYTKRRGGDGYVQKMSKKIE